MLITAENPKTVHVYKTKERAKGHSERSFFQAVPLEFQRFDQPAQGTEFQMEFVCKLLMAPPQKQYLLLCIQMSYGMGNLLDLIDYIEVQANSLIQCGRNSGSKSDFFLGHKIRAQLQIWAADEILSLLKVSRFIGLPRVALLPIAELTAGQKVLFLLVAIGAEKKRQEQIVRWQLVHLLVTNVAGVVAELKQLYEQYIQPLMKEYGLSQAKAHDFFEAMQACKVLVAKLEKPKSALNLFELEIFAASITVHCKEYTYEMTILAKLDILVNYCEQFDYQGIAPEMTEFKNLFCDIVLLAGSEHRQRILTKQSRKSVVSLFDIFQKRQTQRMSHNVVETLADLQCKFSLGSGDDHSAKAVDIVPEIMKRYNGSRFRGKWKTFSGKDKTFSRSDKEVVLQEMLAHVDKCRPVAYSSNPVVRFFGTTGGSTRRALIAALSEDQRDVMKSRFKQGSVSVDEYKLAFGVR